MITFSNDDDFIYLRGVLSSDKSMMEIYHNAVWSKAKKWWRLPLNKHVMTELWRTFPDLRKSREFTGLGQRVKSEFDKRVDLRKLCRVQVLGGGGLESRLRPYQWEDVSYLSDIPYGGIFNEPRTGKTPVAIEIMRQIGKRRNLVVCPASLTLNWKNEIEKWWPQATTIVIKDLKSWDTWAGMSRECPTVAVVSKNLLATKLHHNVLGSLLFHTAFIDEAHFLRNYGTMQSKAIFKIKADRRYAMTGTPTINHPSDIWGILHYLDPAAYPSYWQFTARYFETWESMYSQGLEAGKPKPHREKELQELVGISSVQRKRIEVMPWLPAKQRSVLPVKMDGKQLKLYNEMRDFFTATDDDVEIDTPNIMGQLMRMRQLCLDPRLIGFNVPGVKTKALLDYLENRREPVVVMTMFTSYLKLIAPEIKGRKVGFIHGEMSATQKQKSVSDFQSGKSDVLLCNIIAAGIGHTLDAGNTVLFLDRAWTPAENDQAEDRVCPVDESRNHAHLIIDLECADSVDERINKVLSQKRSLTDYINEGGREAIRRLIG